MILYGIKNCDTVRKARQWLDTSGLYYHFHDFRHQGLDAQTIHRWLDQVGPDKLINKRSTTWKQLDDNTRARAQAGEDIPSLLAAQPTLIKRPVLEHNGGITVGFSYDLYREHLSD